MADPRVRQTVERAGRTLARVAEGLEPRVSVTEEGSVLSERDGVLRISGLAGARAEEVLSVGRGHPALVLGLSKEHVLAAQLSPHGTVREGDRVRPTGVGPTIRVGAGVVGRVLDPLGAPLDGRPLTGPSQPLPVERQAPPIAARGAVHRPLYTGVLGIDAMFPIGRGQRELVVGDEGTGRTSLVLTAMLRQASTDVIPVYVAIGRRRAEVWQITEALREAGGRFVVVAAFEDDAPALRYLAPYAGTSVAEWFRDRGEHALVVYDDLSAHAVAWRELSLLLERPPGREAFPGDVFWLHARLLERATQLSGELGGGSLTALPVATTEDGRLSAYIPTNLISITDGQVVLSRELFAAGHRPAIDAGLSVSRVGGRAQAQAFRLLASRMRLDYASFLELERFSRVGTRLESEARRRLEHGRRLRRLMRAPRSRVLGVLDELVRLALADEADALVTVPEDRVDEVADDLVATLRTRDPARARHLEEDVVLTEHDRHALSQLIATRVAALVGDGG
ncbi:MAG: F0F1 ATP synthase subunit alpha [Alphaproteobacteria bacterium]|nr:F0F1 ATP synthase subunit alpha [Alphaproteobacteria bacterium]